MNIFGKNFTIGADPEVFVGLNGNFVSAHNLVPGTKLDPFPVNKGAVQVDGLALEFNINPSHTFDEFYNNMTVVQDQLRGMIGDKEFLNATSVIFDENFIKDIPIENLLLGCEGDFNGWTGEMNVPPECTTLMRTAGGHVHIGGFFEDDIFLPKHFNEGARLARLMDQEVGVYSILWDKDDQRRAMYGKAGCFRPKPYGMEYRTMSNSWIFNKQLMKFVFDGVERALGKFVGGMDADPIVAEIINNSDRSHPYLNDELTKQVKGIVAC